jgi:PIN domain nuclease of toxin-antitoxin system
VRYDAAGSASQLVLDTHVWLWSVQRRFDRLAAKVGDLIERAAERGELTASAMSAWELVMLERKGRLTFALPVAQWIQVTRRSPGIRVLPVDLAIATDAGALPDLDTTYGLNDPADHIIIATARAHGTLVTCDRRILGWAREHRHVNVIDGRA